MNAVSQHAQLNLPSTAKGDRIYAIGDVHGRFDLLNGLLSMIEAHVETLPRANGTNLIVLGDMIDRGPDSAKVLQFLKRASENGRLTVLMGNHEDIMLRAIDGEPGVMKAWMRMGGDATLRSFGVEPPGDDYDQVALSRTIRKAVPEALLEWLRKLPLFARSGDYYFCHAGIRPGVDLKKQKRTDLLWIREEFLTNDDAHEAVIIHGHSISPDVELRHNRIGVDTGAYRTDMLTSVYLDGRACGIISTGNPERT